MSAAGRCILIAEDEQQLRKMLVTALKKEGYTVLSAPNGTTALNLARKHEGEINLLVTDLVMPQMGGFDVREKLLLERPRMRVLVMSGNLDPEVRGEDFPIIRKPFTVPEFVDKVRQVLG